LATGLFSISEPADVVVVGGGVIGLSVARALAHKHVGKVVIIERGQLGKEASFAAAGMLAPQAEANEADDFFKLCCRSRDLYPTFASELLSETGIDIELDQTGTLYCAFSEHDQQEIERRYHWQQQAGLLVARLTAREALDLEPNIAATLHAALKFPEDIQVENRRLLQALIAANEKLGVRIYTDTRVDSLAVQQSRIAGVKTSLGLLSSRSVVVASGAWTSLIKIENSASQISIEPVRGQMVCYETEPAIARHVIYSPRGYVVPRRDGRLLAGSTTEEVRFKKEVTEAGQQLIRTNACEITPVLSKLTPVDSWAGLRPRALDELPLLGKASETEGLFFATGHYRNGILLAPLTGELIAGLIADNVMTQELQTFTPDRFQAVGVN
jgi:glycine oxidase